MRISCWGYYGKSNLGDDLILELLLQHLNSCPESKQVRVFSGKGCWKHMIPDGADVKPLSRDVKSLIRESFISDFLIFGPGGLMPQRNTGKLCLWLAVTALMKIRGKRVAYLGMGIGHQNFVHPIDRVLIKSIIRISDGFVVRQAGVPAALNCPQKSAHQLVEAADVVFSRKLPAKTQRACKCRSVVISLAYIFENAATDEMDAFICGITRYVDRLLAEGYLIHFVEFTQNNDMYLYERILKGVNAQDAVFVHRYCDGADAMIRAFQNAEFCICMRFHALVFAVLTATPCCIIAYSDKMDDLAERAGIAQYLLRICPIDTLYYQKRIPIDWEAFEQLLCKVQQESAAIRAVLEKNRVNMQQEAEKNWTILSDILHAKH